MPPYVSLNFYFSPRRDRELGFSELVDGGEDDAVEAVASTGGGEEGGGEADGAAC